MSSSLISKTENFINKYYFIILDRERFLLEKNGPVTLNPTKYNPRCGSQADLPFFNCYRDPIVELIPAIGQSIGRKPKSESEY